MRDLEDYTIGATDGSIGKVKDFYFDDEAWVIRYFIVDTGSWLQSRKVLISPLAIGKPNWAERILPVEITQEQVRNSPDIDTEQPVSRQHEKTYLSYYGYPYYWGGVGLWGGDLFPGKPLPGLEGSGLAPADHAAAQGAEMQAEAALRGDEDPHLRSCKAVIDYHILASDGQIGHVQGFLVDEKTWAIRYLVVNTSNWWLGHEVLIAPKWIENVSWSGSTVSVGLTQQAVQDAPAYDPNAPVERQEELGLYTHYGRTGHGADGKKHEAVLPGD
ncbi:PRC-barrel domain-containing protein [Andreprevotia chitinilytica]|uniref:PRC-barrel domain-containing protein n=1 Tax=Andreprevotia chitinilytica TaxID=396808 RepID=UPI001B803242|nr:PRC-barrel domain-containing protein [Andreprevotia chitinilytica]